MVQKIGLEPTFTAPITDNGFVDQSGYFCMVRGVRIERTSFDSKSNILPIDDPRILFYVFGGIPSRSQT